jgi:hypothetical protein
VLEKRLDEAKAQINAKPAPPPTAVPSTTSAPPQGLLYILWTLCMFSLFTTGNPLTWTVADVSKWLESIGKSKFCASFKDHEINGQCLHDMDDKKLQFLEVKLPAHRATMLRLIRELFAPRG